MDLTAVFAAPPRGSPFDGADRLLLDALRDGLPLTERPYADVGAPIGMSEEEVIERLSRLKLVGVIRRFGVVVRHHEVGYRANAMVVWDVPDDEAAVYGQRIAAFPFVTLCYRRERSLPVWPYNLYCMIHGRDRARVEARIAQLIEQCGLGASPHAVLFSRRRFKQCGASYGRTVRSKRDASAGTGAPPGRRGSQHERD